MNLKEYIAKNGYKQIQIAKLININFSSLNLFLNGWQQVAKHHELNLMKLLKLSEKEFNKLKDKTFNA